MTPLAFRSNARPTLGIEIELGLVDVESMALSNSFARLLDELPEQGRERFKPELMQSVLEINTDVCESVGDADRELRGRIGVVEAAADRLGLGLWWGGIHPFSTAADQRITPEDRYIKLVELLQKLASQLVTFGLHIHVGVDSGDKAVMICDRILRHLPTLLALSCSSPFWEGQPTGLKSYRSKIMGLLPTAGLPPQMRNWSEYVWLVNHMQATGFINSIRELWWDVRPHHNFGTVEVRVCDMPGSLDDLLALAALVQCLVQALSIEIDGGAYQHDAHPVIVSQNKWRAARYGTAAKLVDPLTFETDSVEAVVARLVDRLRPTADDLGCVAYLERCNAIAASETWADRQLALSQNGADSVEVVRQLVRASRLSAATSAQPK
jgi:glutamate---cysteine ligase / carboxylate-amine ligase